MSNPEHSDRNGRPELLDVADLKPKKTHPLLIAAAIATAIGAAGYVKHDTDERSKRAEAAAFAENKLDSIIVPQLLTDVSQLESEPNNPNLFKIQIPYECRNHLVAGLLDRIKAEFEKTHPQVRVKNLLGNHRFDYSHSNEMIVYLETEPTEIATKNE